MGWIKTKKIYRVFQKDFLEKDIWVNLTLPKASASVWNDPLENPLSTVYDVDIVTGLNIHIGSLVSSLHALCWTHRAAPRLSDWTNFSHGKESMRITSTVGKLMDRMMRVSAKCYMHRSWLIEVDYKDPSVIQQMKNPKEVYRRIDSQGALVKRGSSPLKISG